MRLSCPARLHFERDFSNSRKPDDGKTTFALCALPERFLVNHGAPCAERARPTEQVEQPNKASAGLLIMIFSIDTGAQACLA
jgi:hypothetical protein